jgi:hypothetical protein
MPEKAESLRPSIFVVQRDAADDGFEPVGVFESEEDAAAAVADGFGSHLEAVPLFRTGDRGPDMVTIWWAETRRGGEIVARSQRVERDSVADIGDVVEVIDPGRFAVGRDRNATIAALREQRPGPTNPTPTNTGFCCD